jgi:predicted nucleic acid-binding protein
MPGDTIIVDASIAVKWFHEEEDSPSAERLQERIASGEVRAIVPPLLFYEVANVLTLKAGSEVEGIIAAHRVLLHLPFQVMEVVHTVFEDAVRIAHHYRLSVYDAIYVALAIETGSKLVTADRALRDKVDLPIVVSLEEFSRDA